MRRELVVAVIGLELAACSGGQQEPVDESRTAGAVQGLVAVELVAGLAEFPVDMRFTGDGRLLYTARGTNEIRTVETPTWRLASEPYATLPARTRFFEDGVIGIELDPDFGSNGLSYSSFVDDDGAGHVVRLREEQGRIVEQATLLTLRGGDSHPIACLRFGPDGMLYAAGVRITKAGEAYELAGSILRIDPRDGSAPPDNPAPGELEFATGFRNPFGFDFHPQTGRMWLVDNGPDHDDELNVVVPGAHHGWDGNDHNMGMLGRADRVDPLKATGKNQIGPTALVFVSESTAYGEGLRGQALFGDSNSGAIRRVVPGGPALDEIAHLGVLFEGESSAVALVVGPDGLVYFSTAGGSIGRLEPRR